MAASIELFMLCYKWWHLLANCIKTPESEEKPISASYNSILSQPKPAVTDIILTDWFFWTKNNIVDVKLKVM